MSLPRRKPGPPPKGDRSHLTLRLPKEHRAVYEFSAADGGYGNLNDYLTAVLATLHQLPMPDYIKIGDEPRPRRTVQDRLFSSPAA